MGCCISKCKRKRKHKKEESNNHIEDKLVISQAPISPIPLPLPLSSSTKQQQQQQPLSPHSPTSSSSISSFSCTTSNISNSCSLSSLSSSSSIITSKERLFSNEFLWSCVKENPHVIHIDPSKGSLEKLQKLEKPTTQNVVPMKHVGSTPQKRARAISPTLSRQKSFRREPERTNSMYSVSSRTLTSPSPSRRFSSGDNYTGGSRIAPKESCCKRSVMSKRKENLRPLSPNNNLSINQPCLMNREAHTYRIGSKIDEIAVGEVLDKQDTGDIHMEDIDNPLIALDCFIFL
ncbi:uncharacterized serine-rich protein C215.13-like [Camellia sinensis]|uniref:Uncharacterized protein n=1 Tax=Camellia sinensis var. sinensis TaxID=542762 RepID=A0A4S4ESB4_CAMSN|nr:uncharacterized serine-rich protein C215.13-like [Camellia sinensis]THG19709.1 hypothetical protein TEA_004354 [Camellia sinensis var. sinensis]